MLKLSRISILSSLHNFQKFTTKKIQASFDIVDVKNSHLFYVKDATSYLPYFSEIQTEQGYKGIVIKLEDNSKSVIGLYQHADIKDKINITKVIKSKNLLNNFSPNLNTVYNLNLEQIDHVKDVHNKLSMKCQLQKQGKRYRIKTLSPILTLCHDLFIGDFINFTGSFGSGRTSTALKILQQFTNSQFTEPIGIYLNTNKNDYRQTCFKAANTFGTISFGRSLTENKITQQISGMSSVGVYILAVKVIMLAKKLKTEGKNVMLIVDNIHEILANEWTVLQCLKFPISPFSILNELYSSCSEVVHQNNSMNKSGGSLTAITISNRQQQDILQQYSTIGNNSKHLQTLSPPIEFPLQLLVNTNKASSNTITSLRQSINCLIREKKEKDLLNRLKLMQQQPWQHYFILDSEWWSTALRKYTPISVGDQTLFLWFIQKNIRQDYVAHWGIDCISAYNRYLEYLAKPQDPSTVGMEERQLSSFIEICKNQKIFFIFKKDYLK